MNSPLCYPRVSNVSEEEKKATNEPREPRVLFLLEEHEFSDENLLENEGRIFEKLLRNFSQSNKGKRMTTTKGRNPLIVTENLITFIRKL